MPNRYTTVTEKFFAIFTANISLSQFTDTISHLKPYESKLYLSAQPQPEVF